MDLRLSLDDKVGGNTSKRKKKKSAPKKRTAPTRATKTKTTARKATTNRKKTSRRRKRKPLTLGRIIGKLFYWGLVLGLWAGIGVVGIIAYYGLQLPAANTWAVPERPANIRIVAADGQLISNRGKMGGEAVAYHELPYYVPAAVIAIEDRRFMSHFGVDPVGILGAALDNISEKRLWRGGSTLTQQLAKNLFLTPEQTLGRKVQEALIALWLERNYSKEQILELYLNRVYFGAGSTGIEGASLRYFGKSARNLSLGEAAIMAGLLKAPSRLSPDRHPKDSAARARVVLNAMADQDYITVEEARAASIDPTKRIRTRVPGAEYYVADWVETLMEAYVGSVDTDVIVTTTINWDLQKNAEFLVKEVVEQNGADKNFSQGALVSMNSDGAVQAIVGGTDYGKSQYNRAVTARRQPGSSFKPFVYLSALEAGYTPETVVDDAPLNYKGWQPQNYNGKYVGPVRLRDALANSLNTVAARLAIDVGADTVVNTAMRLGISSSLDPVPSIALGTQEVSLLELTAAYAPFSNGGRGVIAHVITRVETPEGEVLYENIPTGPGQVIGINEVGMMNNMMRQAVDVGTGKKARLSGWPVAGKTGTTQNNRDAVFVGYSSRIITGVWVGNDDGSAMKGVGGGSFPAELWASYMKRAHKGLRSSELPGAYAPIFQQQRPQQGQNSGDQKNLVDIIQEWFN